MAPLTDEGGSEDCETQGSVSMHREKGETLQPKDQVPKHLSEKEEKQMSSAAVHQPNNSPFWAWSASSCRMDHPAMALACFWAYTAGSFGARYSPAFLCDHPNDQIGAWTGWQGRPAGPLPS